MTIELGSSDGNQTIISVNNRYITLIRAYPVVMSTIRVGLWVVSQPENRENRKENRERFFFFSVMKDAVN
jgi:hypothetical protein